MEHDINVGECFFFRELISVLRLFREIRRIV